MKVIFVEYFCPSSFRLSRFYNFFYIRLSRTKLFQIYMTQFRYILNKLYEGKPDLKSVWSKALNMN